MKNISFASDNNAGIHPDILKAIAAANHSYAPAYGNDDYTKRAEKKFSEHFGEDSQSFIVFNGTGANVTSFCAMCRPYEAVICSDKGHINVDECGAPEKITGSKLLTIPSNDGKVTIEGIQKYLHRANDPHHVKPRIVSITQTTEYGNVYTLDEIRRIADFSHENNMLLHMDGSRIANAAASLGVSLRAATRDVGVDVLSFGGTKNGLLLGEAVVFFKPELAENFLYIRKQNLQLASKMRFVAVQFETLLSNDLWLRNAQQANNMAALLARQLAAVPGINFTQPVESNAVFATMPLDLIQRLQEKFYFYVWKNNASEVRLMTSFETTEAEIEAFIEAVKA